MNVTRVVVDATRTFTLTSPQHMAAIVNGVTTTGSSNGCVALSLFDSSGNQLANGISFNDTPVYDGYIDLTPGTYTLRFEIFNPSALGNGTLWVSQAKSLGSVRVNGSSVPMNVTRVGEDVTRTFNGQS